MVGKQQKAKQSIEEKKLSSFAFPFSPLFSPRRGCGQQGARRARRGGGKGSAGSRSDARGDAGGKRERHWKVGGGGGARR